MNDSPTGRSPQAQLTTARILLAQFYEQINEYEAMNREQRRTPRGRDLAARIDGLRDGQAKWRQRAAQLEAQITDDIGASDS